jgi:hypothetical protein
MSVLSDSAVATKVAAGAPDAEIVVTPEMIEAGVSALDVACGAYSNESLVRAVYIAMRRARSLLSSEADAAGFQRLYG